MASPDKANLLPYLNHQFLGPYSKGGRGCLRTKRKRFLCQSTGLLSDYRRYDNKIDNTWIPLAITIAVCNMSQYAIQ